MACSRGRGFLLPLQLPQDGMVGVGVGQPLQQLSLDLLRLRLAAQLAIEEAKLILMINPAQGLRSLLLPLVPPLLQDSDCLGEVPLPSWGP